MAEVIALWTICGVLLVLSAMAGLVALLMLARETCNDGVDAIFVVVGVMLVGAAFTGYQGALAWDKLHGPQAVIEGKP